MDSLETIEWVAGAIFAVLTGFGGVIMGVYSRINKVEKEVYDRIDDLEKDTKADVNQLRNELSAYIADSAAFRLRVISDIGNTAKRDDIDRLYNRLQEREDRIMAALSIQRNINGGSNGRSG